MIRTRSADFLNAVANDPAVRPTIGGAGTVDLSQALADPLNIALIDEFGGFVFEFHDAGRYELHTLFLPAGRGAHVLPAAAAAFRHIFTATEAIEIVTRVPASNRAADLMARRAGFSPIFRRENAWPDGSALTYFMLGLDAWRTLDGDLAALGHDFHGLIEAAKAETGSALPTHPDDDAHDRAAGAAVLMALAGQPRKSVWAYNRWARLAGYASIELLGEEPVRIDVRDAVVGVLDGRLEVFECR